LKKGRSPGRQTPVEGSLEGTYYHTEDQRWSSLDVAAPAVLGLGQMMY